MGNKFREGGEADYLAALEAEEEATVSGLHHMPPHRQRNGHGAIATGRKFLPSLFS